MRRSHSPHSVRSSQVEAVRLLEQILDLKSYGRHLTGNILAQVLVWMAAMRSTCNAAATRLKLVIKQETLRKALMALLPQSIDPILELIPASLKPKVLKRLRRRKRGFYVAIDLHHQPYYGKNVKGIFRAKAQSGTKQFWTIATAVIVERGHRLTLAVVPVHSNRMEDVLDAVWRHLVKLDVKIRWLLLDRGFYGAPVVHWLQERRIPFLMPMIKRGDANKGTGTTPFFQSGRRGFASYRWRERNRGRYVEVRVAMVPLTDRNRSHVYICDGPALALHQVSAMYKRRFGIETSYREKNMASGWTTSHNELWRRLLQVIAFVIRNLWIQAQWVQAKPEGSPGRQFILRFAHFLNTIEALLDLELRLPAGLVEIE